MRKEAGFDVVDRIRVYYTVDGDVVKSAINGTAFRSVVLADEVIEGNYEGYTKELDVNGTTVTVTVVKVK